MRTGAAPSTRTTAATPTTGAAAPSAWDDTDRTADEATDVRHGLRFTVRLPATDELPPDDRALRVVVTVLRSAPPRVRRSIARTAGLRVLCDPPGTPPKGTRRTQAVAVAPSGPRSAAPVGHRIETGPFFRVPAGTAPSDAIATCGLGVAFERRGSTEKTYSDGNVLGAARFG